MAQRGSGYERQPDELYETPRWVAAVIGQWLREAGVRSVWEPAPGSGRFAGYLRDEGCEVTTTAGLSMGAAAVNHAAARRIP